MEIKLFNIILLDATAKFHKHILFAGDFVIRLGPHPMQTDCRAIHPMLIDIHLH